MSENTGILLETKDLSKYFTAKKGLLNRNPSVVKAVDHVSLSVRKGETLAWSESPAAENPLWEELFSA